MPGFSETASPTVLGSIKANVVGRMSVAAQMTRFLVKVLSVRVVSGNTAFIKSAITFINALRPTAVSSIFPRVAIHLYGWSDFIFFVTCLL
jgi:hypothetical protein